jgi:hypothetical protein
MKTAIALCLLLASAARAAEPAQEQYDRQYIGFDDLWATKGAATQRWVEPYLGKYKVPLSAPDFYRRVGRADLADDYESRAWRSGALIVAGSAVTVGAIIAGVVVASQGQSAPCDVASPDFGQCASASASQTRSRINTASLIGVGGALAGGTLFLAGLLTGPRPVSGPEMREMADRYNQDLKAQLGVAAIARPDGGGMALSVQF